MRRAAALALFLLAACGSTQSVGPNVSLHLTQVGLASEVLSLGGR